MQKTEYHLIDSEALPGGFWQTTGEDPETITRLERLAHSLRRSGVCWLVWNRDHQTLYEQRDLYQCSVVRVVDHDVIRGRATPCGNLCRRESLPIFFPVSQFWQILATDTETDQSCKARVPESCAV